MATLTKEVVLIGMAAAFLGIVAIGIVLLVLIHQKKQLQHISEKKVLQQNFETQMMQTRLDIQGETLQNISAEIHDNIGQVLSLAKLHLGTVPPIQNEIAAEKIRTVAELVSKALLDLRTLSHGINADYINGLGLIRAIEFEVELIRKTGLFDTHMSITGQYCPLDKQKELILFRIIQELLSNSIRHACAHRINLEITYQPGRLLLCLSDNGHGYNTANLPNGHSSSGIGLRNVADRTKSIGGSLTVQSTPQTGTRTMISVPCDAGI